MTQAKTPEEFFLDGLTAYQQGNLESARGSFIDSLAVEQRNPNAIYNLGLTEFRLGHVGLALGLWRKALALDPYHSNARRTLEKVLEESSSLIATRENSFFDYLQKYVLSRVTLTFCLTIAAIILLWTGWLVLAYVGDRRQAQIDNQPPPSPTLAFWGSILFLLLAACTSVAKYATLDTLRGTITSQKADVRSTPDTQGTLLFSLNEGLEVIVQQTKGDWVQISYSQDTVGWIQKNEIFTTADWVTK